jgi:hypothetical protein
MAHKQWYEEIAEMNSAREREEFMKGMFGMRSKERQPIMAWLVAGYVAGKTVSNAKKK